MIAVQTSSVAQRAFVAFTGLVVVGFGGYMGWDAYTDVQRFATGNGVIVDVTFGSGKGITYAPIIEFQTPDGVKHTFKSRFNSSSKPSVGDTAKVLYDPSHPEDARVDSVFELYLFPLIFVGFGMLAILAVTVLPFLKRGSDRKRDEQLAVRGVRVTAQVEVKHMGKLHWIEAKSSQPPLMAETLFRSEPSSDDPTPLLGGKTTVMVLVDPAHPKVYRMELPVEKL